MISPGCSFTFDGLKQTLLKLEGGIEEKIKQVEHLLVNYRTTKDILALGNAILAKARHYFPSVIDFAKPETARKDLGLKVVVCNWKAALRTQTKFGENQAFIYSTSCANEIILQANTWLNGHPFVLSSLESKGLEFDDVVVAFEQDRKVWQLQHRREDSLSMLRELYVAVTRAQKRVVVLLKEEIPAIAAFFLSLECDLEVSDGRVFEEFNCDTSTEEWFVRAQALFKNEQFKFAASCFTRAERQDWAFLSKGQELVMLGLELEATKEIRKAARVFFEVQDNEQILDILKILLDFKTSEWDTSDDHIFLATLQKCPNALSTVQSIQYAIHRKDFSSVRVDALKDQNVCKFLVHHRQAGWLVQLVAESSEEDREFIGESMPLVIIDYHRARSQHFEACKVALKAREYKLADSSTIALLDETKKKSTFDPEAVIRVANLWANVESNRVLTSLLLYKLLHAPKSLSSMQKEECLRLLGKDIILLAYRRNNLAVEFLLGFSTVAFKSEVESCLMRQQGTCPFDVAKWYDRHGFPALSAQFIRDRLKQWNNCDLLRSSLLLYIRPQWLFQEFNDRKLSRVAMMLNILSPTLSISSKEQFWKGYVVHGEPPSHLAKKEFADLDLKYHARGLTNFFHLLERLGHCIEAVFLQVYLHYCGTTAAARRSLEALKTRQLVHLNLSELLRIWAEESAMKQSLFPGVQMKSYKDIYGLLMCIYFDVAPTPDLCQVFAAATDTVTPMLMAFGPAAFTYCQMNPFESPHHDENLFQNLVAFHAELASRCSCIIRKVDLAGSGPLSGSRSAEATNAKPMSKKEARKQKQSLAKRQPENKPATSGGGGGKKKRNNNKKKKGGRK
jgi:tetratricopeptide (TPR) repeat protein